MQIRLISDFSVIDKESIRLLSDMSNHNDVILVHIYDEMEESLPDGQLVLTDGKRQLTWNNRRHNRQDTYRQSFREMQKQLTDEFLHSRIPMVFFSTTEPIEDQMIRELATHSKRGMDKI